MGLHCTKIKADASVRKARAGAFLNEIESGELVSIRQCIFAKNWSILASLVRYVYAIEWGQGI